MSYDIHIWDSARHQPAPTTLDDAARIFLALRGVKDEVNPKFVDFAQKLVAKYPSRDMYEKGDQDAYDSPWLDNPVEKARTNGNALFSVSLPLAERAELTRFVVDAANTSGLMAYDDQLGMAFLPNGEVLPADGRAMWAQFKQELDAAPPPVTKANLRKAVWQVFDAQLGQRGFKVGKGLWANREFLRSVPVGIQYVTLGVDGASPDFVCHLTLSMLCDPVHAILERVLGDDSGAPDTFRYSLAHFVNRTNIGLPVNSPQEIKMAQALLETRGLPLLNAAREIKGIDAVMSGDGADLNYFDTHHSAHRLIVARLAGNPRFESIVEYLDAFTKNRKDRSRERFLKLVPYLREHVKPVV